MQEHWASIEVYNVIRERRAGRPTFMLHDGPPYTNTPVHLGTALNKCLKDFVVKYKTLRGFDAPYIPGFDNHGLPIELAVMKSLPKGASTAQVRDACRKHASEFIEIQSEQFQRLGVIGDWGNRYATMDFAFEAEIIRAFSLLAQAGYIYRDLKPTHWSTYSRTALADTEIVYRDDHESQAVYVRFPFMSAPDGSPIPKHEGRLFALIWTTTPWTIPANLAIAFHPELVYAIVEHRGDSYIVLDSLTDRVAADLGWDKPKRFGKCKGAEFERWSFKHPLYERSSLGVLAEYVTTDEGTGLVHTAPGHGADDFRTGRKYGLPILCPVDASGNFTSDAGEFAGTSITDADQTVPAALERGGYLVKSYKYTHRYPYGERDGHPVIFRSTEQWFIRLDHRDLRSNAIAAAESVEWFPRAQSERLRSMLATRPDWCISRQRIWGVGIPVVYGSESGAPVFDPVIMENAARLVEERGSSAWFTTPIEELIPDGFRHPETGETRFRREDDILDVWFDSGVTHLAVLDVKYRDSWQRATWPADLYLEGSDQHRGWFNSSMLTAVATKSSPPYRQVLTHGFVFDEKGEKMSKSKGNVIEPIDASNSYGADVLRLWAATVDYSSDVPCSENLLKQVGEMYRRIRNTLRFLLANLYDFDPHVDYAPSWELNAWICERMRAVTGEACGLFDRYDFSQALHTIHGFCVQDLSSFYLDAIKDCMYCDLPDSPRRRDCQSACSYLLQTLTKLVAPVLSHTAEEVYSATPKSQSLPTVLVEELDDVSDFPNSQFSAITLDRFSNLLSFKNRLYVQLEEWKSESGIKDSQDVSVNARVEARLAHDLSHFGTDLANLLRVASVDIASDSTESINLKASISEKCERCRLRRGDVSHRVGHLLCDRCFAVVSKCGS